MSVHPDDGSFPVALSDTLDGVLGLEIISVTDQEAEAQFVVSDRVRQRWGIVHGGAYAAIAELLASEATNHGVYDAGFLALGLSNTTNFLRPVFSGTVRAQARRLHRGQTTWLWDVTLTDDHGRCCAVSRVTIAVRSRELPGKPPA